MDLWEKQLAGDKPPIPQKSRSAPRFILAAGLERWSKIIGTEKPLERSDQTKRLVERLLPLIIAAREEGTRGSVAVQSQDVATAAESFALGLMNLSPDDLAV